MNRSVCMPWWLFVRFILRRSTQNPIRLVLLVLAVAAATTLLSAVAVVSLAGVRAFEESLGFGPKLYPLALSPRGGRIALTELGRCLAPLQDKFDIVAYRRESGVINPKRSNKAIAVVGVSGVGGDGPEGLSEGEILLSEGALKGHNLLEGEVIEIALDNRIVTGRARINRNVQDHSLEGVALLPLHALADPSQDGVIDTLLFRPHQQGELSRYREELHDWLTSCSRVGVPFQVDTPRTRVLHGEGLIAAYRFNVGVMALMTLMVCALLVSQATQISLRNLSRELSILRTLGTSSMASLTGVVCEAALVALIGASVGVTLGAPLTVWITEFFLQTAHDIYNVNLAPDIHAVSLRIFVVLGMVAISVLGAGAGSIEALRISPGLGTRSVYARLRGISGPLSVALLLSGVMLVLGLAIFSQLNTGVAVAYLFIAASMIAVLMAMPFALFTAPKVLRLMPGGVVVWLARGGIRIGGRGFLLGAAGIGVGISLISALSIMVGSFRATLESWTSQRLHGDLFVSAALDGKGNETRISPQLQSRVEGLEGVRRVIPYFEVMTSYKGSALVVSASDTGAQIERGVYVISSGVIDRDALRKGRGALASESAVRKLGLKIGDQVLVDDTVLSIIAIMKEFGTEHPVLHIDQQLFRSIYSGHRPDNLTIDIRQGAEIDRVRHNLEGVVGSAGIVRDQSELRSLVLTLFDRTFSVTLSIRWIVFGMALFGFLLASLQLLWERRREVKTMHVLGFSNREILLVNLVESVCVSMVPVGMGLVGGLVMGWGLVGLVNPRSFGWSLDFVLTAEPLVIAILFMCSVVIVVWVTSNSALDRIIEEATLYDE